MKNHFKMDKLEQSAHEFAKRVQMLRLSGLQSMAGVQGSSTTHSEQLLGLRQVCGRLLRTIAYKSPLPEIITLLSEIDGQVRLAISTGLISGGDSEEFLGLVDNLYDSAEIK